MEKHFPLRELTVELSKVPRETSFLACPTLRCLTVKYADDDRGIARWTRRGAMLGALGRQHEQNLTFSKLLRDLPRLEALTFMNTKPPDRDPDPRGTYSNDIRSRELPEHYEIAESHYLCGFFFPVMTSLVHLSFNLVDFDKPGIDSIRRLPNLSSLFVWCRASLCFDYKVVDAFASTKLRKLVIQGKAPLSAQIFYAIKQCKQLEMLKIGVDSVFGWSELTHADFIDVSRRRGVNPRLYHLEISCWIVRQRPQCEQDGNFTASSIDAIKSKRRERANYRSKSIHWTAATKHLAVTPDKTYGIYWTSCINGWVPMDRGRCLNTKQTAQWFRTGQLPAAVVH